MLGRKVHEEHPYLAQMLLCGMVWEQNNPKVLVPLQLDGPQIMPQSVTDRGTVPETRKT